MRTLVDAGNFHRSCYVAKGKMVKMCIFIKNGHVSNWSFVKAIHKSNDILYTKDLVEIMCAKGICIRMSVDVLN